MDLLNKKLRIAIDSGMVLLLPLLMAYSLVGENAHEYFGMILSRYVFRFLHLGGAATARTVHLSTSVNFHQDTISHIQAVHQWQVRSMHSLIRV